MATFSDLDNYLNGETAAAPSSQSSFDSLDSYLNQTAKPKTIPKPESTPIQADLSAYKTSSTTLNSLMRGSLGLAERVSSAFGDFEQAQAFQGMARPFAPEAPNVRFDNVGTFALESVASNLPQIGISLGLALIPIAGIPLSLASIAAPLYGESRQKILDETGIDQPYAAGVPASINTALELVPMMSYAKKLGIIPSFQKALKDTGQELADSGFIKLAKDSLSFAGESAAKEGLTELGQWTTNLATVRFLKDSNMLGKLSEEEKTEAINSFFGGVFGGGGFGLAAGAYSSIKEAKTDKAIQREMDEIDYILNNIQTDSSAEIPADAKPVEKLRKNTIDLLKTFDPEVKDGVLQALQQRKLQLEEALTAIQTELQGAFAENKESDYGPARLLRNNASQEIDPAALTYFDLTTPKIQWTRASDGQLVPVPQADIKTFTPGIRVLAAEGQEKSLMDLADIANQFMKEVGYSTADLSPFDFHLTISPEPDSEKYGSSFALNGNTFVISVDPNLTPRQQADTFIHEFSHLLANKIVATSIYNGEKDHIALMEAYNNLIGKDQVIKKATLSKALPSHAELLKNRYTSTQARNSYETSFLEFLAEGFRQALLNRVADGSVDLRIETPNLFRRMEKAFKQLFKLNQQYLGKDTPSTQTFQKFVDRMLLSTRLAEVNAKIEGITKTKGKELAEGKPEQSVPSTVNEDSFIAELLINAKRKKTAQNLNSFMQVNMGILGDSAIGKFFRSTLTPIQVAEQANNRGWSFGQTYMSIVQQFQLMKTTVVDLADRTLKSWGEDGPDSRTRISKALYIISTKSDELGRRLTQNELDQVFTQLNMSQTEQDKWREVDQSFRTVLDQMEASLLYEQARTYNPNPADRQAAKDFRDQYLAAQSQADQNLLVEQFTGQPYLNANLEINPLGQAIIDLNASMEGMRNKNYFPRSRLGEYVVRIKSTDKDQTFDGTMSTKAGETLGFYAFDTQVEQEAFIDSITDEAVKEGLKVLGHKLDSEVFAVMGLPSGIIEQIKRDLDNNPNARLTPLQKELLNDIALQRSPGKRFLQHMTKRKGIKGYSEDAIRVYANYMSTASNHLARSEYSSDLASVLTTMDQDLKNPAANIAEVNDLNVLKDYFTKHFDYLMKADNDFATLRSIGFLWYLGFNVKSAFVNLMQTPMVTLPVLSRDVGTSKATGYITRAMSDSAKFLRGKNPLQGDEAAMIDHMLKANLIDESLVSELAGLGEADALQRLVPGLSAKGVLNQVSWYGGALFRMGEKYNRYLASIAAYRIARKELGKTHDEAIQYTIEAIQASQFEYAKFNRPEFMRGKKSVIFLFWQYLQHASYLFFGGKGSRVAKRMWILALMIAGIEGLPFAQLIFNVLNLFGTTAKTVLGMTDVKTDLQKDLRELITNIYDRPDDIMKGMSYQWGLGPFHLLRPLGVPVPNVTIEGSLGFGNPIPWFDAMLDPSISDMDKALGQTAAAVLGPIGGMVLGVTEAVGYSKEEDSWKRWEKILPTFMKNASQGTRWMVEGEETTSNQNQVVTFETPETRAEAALKSLGFTPTRVDQTRRQMRATQQVILYYQTRKQMLMDDFAYARHTKNREGIADVRQAIREFNSSVKEAGLPKMVIRASSLSRSLSQRAKARALSERGINTTPDAVRAMREMQKLYPVTGG